MRRLLSTCSPLLVLILLDALTANTAAEELQPSTPAPKRRLHENNEKKRTRFVQQKRNLQRQTETLEQLLEWQSQVTNYDWEWILIRLNGAGGLTWVDCCSGADVVVSVEALNVPQPPDVFNQNYRHSMFTFPVVQNSNDPHWYEIGWIAYQRGTARELQIIMSDDDPLFDDVLINSRVSVPNTFDQWIDMTLQQGRHSLEISLRRSVTPITTRAQQDAMALTEILFELADGVNRASLVYRQQPSNSKAVLYMPGYLDSFANPDLLDLFLATGYDFYSLDLRRCGRVRRFLDDPKQAHTFDGSYDELQEEYDLSIDFIKNQKTYTNIVGMCHSVGCLVLFNYLMLKEDDPARVEPFDGYILNSPFLGGWGQVSMLSQFALAHPSLFGQDGILSRGNGLSYVQMALWILYQYDVNARPLIEADLTVGNVLATNAVFDKIDHRMSPITDKPALHLGSLGDFLLSALDVAEQMPRVSVHHSSVILRHNSHDVTLSAVRELNNEALDAILEWLNQHG